MERTLKSENKLFKRHYLSPCGLPTSLQPLPFRWPKNFIFLCCWDEIVLVNFSWCHGFPCYSNSSGVCLFFSWLWWWWWWCLWVCAWIYAYHIHTQEPREARKGYQIWSIGTELQMVVRCRASPAPPKPLPLHGQQMFLATEPSFQSW